MKKNNSCGRIWIHLHDKRQFRMYQYWCRSVKSLQLTNGRLCLMWPHKGHPFSCQLHYGQLSNSYEFSVEVGKYYKSLYRLNIFRRRTIYHCFDLIRVHSYFFRRNDVPQELDLFKFTFIQFDSTSIFRRQWKHVSDARLDYQIR